jgi:SAM-dependent methyltransferase
MTQDTHLGYAFTNQWDEARGRLELLENALDDATHRRMMSVGVGPGWRCLDVGAGGGSVVRWLASQVGPTGHVVATDIEPHFLEPLASPTVTALRHDVVQDPVPQSGFDLVHTRWLLIHLGGREKALDHMLAALKPGGRFLFEEPFADTSVEPDPVVKAGLAQFRATVMARGADMMWAARLPELLAARGLQIDGAEGSQFVFRGGSPLGRFWKISFRQVRDALVAAGRDASDITAALSRFDDPAAWFNWPTTLAVWGRKK